MTALLVFALAFAAGAVAEYYAEAWSIRWTRNVTHDLPFNVPKVEARIRGAQNLTSKLLLLGAVDVAAVFGIREGWLFGVTLFACVHLGAQLGARRAIRDEVWRKYHKRAADLAANKPDEEDDE